MTGGSISWVGPPPTDSGILGIYKDLEIIAITSCGHYQWVGAHPNLFLFFFEGGSVKRW